MKIPSLPRSPRRILVLISGAAAFAAGRAQDAAPEVLEPLVTTATRTPVAPQTLGTAVDFLSADELARRQIGSLSGALDGVAGAPQFASGAPGAGTSLFLRGANSNQTLFLVDGMRLNDPNADYQLFLGGASLGAFDRLEIAHGPQSTLYGSEAMGGVISVRAGRGRGEPSESVMLEAGSFGTVDGVVSAQGARGPYAYSISAEGGRTDNERPNNSFASANLALRLDQQVNERVAVGETVRWFHGRYADPGDRFTNDPNNTETEDNLLATAFADVKLADAWSTHLLLGGQNRRLVSNNPAPNPPYFSPDQETVVTNRRAVLDGQSTFTGLERHRITAGLTAEASQTRNTGFGNINRKESLWAVFAEDEYSPVDDVFLTAGLRNDDFDTFGRATTGRVTAAWLPVPKTLKLRTSYGTGFRAPSFLDLYGQSAYYHGNPTLDPERNHAWDAGVDYYLPANRGTLSATWFDTRYSDLITSTPDFSSVENIQRAETRGVELSARTTLPAGIEASVAYTYLDARNLTDGTRLLRRPRHLFNADVWHDFGHGVSAGSGVGFVADRRDVDAATFLPIAGEDYTVVRLYAAWKATARLELKLRFENLLNEHYEEVNGYPALGSRAFASATWKF